MKSENVTYTACPNFTKLGFRNPSWLAIHQSVLATPTCQRAQDGHFGTTGSPENFVGGGGRRRRKRLTRQQLINLDIWPQNRHLLGARKLTAVSDQWSEQLAGGGRRDWARPEEGTTKYRQPWWSRRVGNRLSLTVRPNSTAAAADPAARRDRAGVVEIRAAMAPAPASTFRAETVVV
jgi:hypothetical protein